MISPKQPPAHHKPPTKSTPISSTTNPSCTMPTLPEAAVISSAASKNSQPSSR